MPPRNVIYYSTIKMKMQYLFVIFCRKSALLSVLYKIANPERKNMGILPDRDSGKAKKIGFSSEILKILFIPRRIYDILYPKMTRKEAHG